jgi:hypothetical protein
LLHRLALLLLHRLALLLLQELLLLLPILIFDHRNFLSLHVVSNRRTDHTIRFLCQNKNG